MALKLTDTSHSDDRTVFIDTSLDTHFAMVVSELHTVSDLKGKIEKEHRLCFTNVGEIVVHALKVKRLGKLYYLPDYMLVSDAFDKAKKTWFLSVDASFVKKHHQEQLLQNPDSNNLLLTCYGFNTNTSQFDQVANRKRKLEHLQETNIDSCKDTSKPDIVSQKLCISTKSDEAKQDSFQQRNKLVGEELQSDQVAKRRKMEHLQEKNIDSGRETSKPEFVSMNDILERSNSIVEEATKIDQLANATLAGLTAKPTDDVHAVSKDSRKKKKKGMKSTNKDQVFSEAPSLRNDDLGTAEGDHKNLGEVPATASAPLQAEHCTTLPEISTKDKQSDIIPGADDVHVASNEKNKNENASLDDSTAQPTKDVHVSNEMGKKKGKGKKSKSKLDQLVAGIPSLGKDEHIDISSEVNHKNLSGEPDTASARLQAEHGRTLQVTSTKDKQSDIIPGADDVHVASSKKNKNENASLDDSTAKPTNDVHVMSNEMGKKSKSKLDQEVAGVPSLRKHVSEEHCNITAEVDRKNLVEEPSIASAPSQAEHGITLAATSTKESQSDIIPGADDVHVPNNNKNKNENASLDGLTCKPADKTENKRRRKSKRKLDLVGAEVPSLGKDEHYNITAEVHHKSLGEKPGTASALHGITLPVISTKETQSDIVPGAEKHALPLLDQSGASVDKAASAADKVINLKSHCPPNAELIASLAVKEPLDQQMDVCESGHKNVSLSRVEGAVEENSASKKGSVLSNKPNSHSQNTTELKIQNVNVSADLCGEKTTDVPIKSCKKIKTRKTKGSVLETVATLGKEDIKEPEPKIFVQPLEAKKDEDLSKTEGKNMQQASKHQGKAENVENRERKNSKRKRKLSEKNLPDMQLEDRNTVDQTSTQTSDNQIKGSAVGNKVNLAKDLSEGFATTNGALVGKMTKTKRAAHIINFKEDQKNGHSDETSSNLQRSLKPNDKQENEKPGESTVQPVKKQPKASRTKTPVSNVLDKVNLIPNEIRSHNVGGAVHLQKNTDSVLVSKSTFQRSRTETKQEILGAAEGKVSKKYNGEILNSSKQNKRLTPGSIFKDDDESSEDEEEVGSDSSTRSPSDHLISDYSDGESNSNLHTPHNGSNNSPKTEGRNMRKSSLSSTKNMALDEIFRSSSRFKLAKRTAAQLVLEEESQKQVDFVPDSQPI
ncbi:uncharacterized protein LOC115712537 [Cannabis sativa]|uniref:uncharacterized protein LOC115712537 n=1 Tax=Cannabis sativa TaxID=3483 RepID=UPI0029CA4362|nr:uncharacterized protein LOC115712537 [Cannabis sativa]